MQSRLLTLLLVTIVSGAIAGFVGAATDGKHDPALAAGRTTFSAGRCPVPSRFHRAFVVAARDASLPLAMLVAVATVESNFNPSAHSGAGARGLLQVMPDTGRDLKLDLSKPSSNILAGARYLRQMLDQFHSTDLALAAYNAGPNAVAKLGASPNQETATYVARVTGLWRSLNGCR